MKFYYFGGNLENKLLEKLEECGFVGVLFTYRQQQGDFFTLLARSMDLSKKIKYMIAIRTHALSPQYLCMINKSINSISKDRLQINLIAGHIKPDELDFGGILGNITDTSSNIDRSNNLIEYLKMLHDMSKNPEVSIPDYYVTTTNPFVFTAASRTNSKMIIPYKEYNLGDWISHDGTSFIDHNLNIKIEGKKVMLSIGPIIRDTQEEIDVFNELIAEHVKQWGPKKPYYTNDTIFVTYEQFCELMKDLESKGIEEVMLHGHPIEERYRIMEYVKRYINSQKAVN